MGGECSSDSNSVSAPLIISYFGEETGKEQRQYQAEEDQVEANNSSHSYHYSSSQGNTSFFKTFFNGLNALSGVGILSIPYALASGGWISLVFLFLIALSCFYTGILIKRCMDVDSGIRTYSDIGGLAFGNTGRAITSVFMYAELYLVVTGFLILEGDNLYKLVPDVGFINFAGLTFGGKGGLVVIVALIILPSVWLDSLSILSFVSASGVLASVIILGSILWNGAFGGIGFHHKGEVLNFSGLSTAVSLYSFCYSAHPVFPTLYTSMKKKHHFSKVLLLCFFCSTFCYAVMAILGYLMFGSKVHSQITLNLPVQNLSSRVAIYTTLVNPVAKYALMMAPVVNATESWFPSCHKKRSLRLLIRTGLVTSQVILALAVPFFGHLMSLIGAFLSVTASVTIPCLCYLKIKGTNSSAELVLILAIILFGNVIMISGTYTSLLQLIADNSVGYLGSL